MPGNANPSISTSSRLSHPHHGEVEVLVLDGNRRRRRHGGVVLTYALTTDRNAAAWETEFSPSQAGASNLIRNAGPTESTCVNALLRTASHVKALAACRAPTEIRSLEFRPTSLARAVQSTEHHGRFTSGLRDQTCARPNRVTAIPAAKPITSVKKQSSSSRRGTTPASVADPHCHGGQVSLQSGVSLPITTRALRAHASSSGASGASSLTRR